MQETPPSLATLVAALSVAGTATAAPISAQYDADAPEPIAKLAGSFVLGGAEDLPDSVFERFRRLAGEDDARLVVLATAELVPDAVERWPDVLQSDDVLVLDALAGDDGTTPEALAAAIAGSTGVWLTSDSPGVFTGAYRGTAVERELAALVTRGGVVGADPGAGPCAAFLTLGEGEADPDAREGLVRLPGAFASAVPSPEAAAELAARVHGEEPGLVVLGVDEGTALFLEGRSLRAIGSGGVTIHVAASATRPARVERLGRRRGRPDVADLIALSRSAVARAAPRFPSAAPPVPEVEHGALLIAGGGGLGPDLLGRFIELAGGPEAQIVYVPCTEAERVEREPGFVRLLRSNGAKNVTWIHTKDRTKSDTADEILEPLRGAGGVWFGGGRQWNLVDSYQNTEAHRLMHEVLARGGVIGGSSAGASIQADYMARGNPLGNLDIMAEGYERGLGFITGVAIDQHFSQRKRQKDMSSLVETYPQLLGIGLDEGIAIVVQGSVAEVAGRGGHQAFFYDRRGRDEERVVSLEPGSRYDLAKRDEVAD